MSLVYGVFDSGSFAHKREDETGSSETSEDDGDDPANFVLSSPPIDKQSDRQQGYTQYNWKEAVSNGC